MTKSFKDYKQYIRNGIERESLRVDEQGLISKHAHPPKLGHKLTHPHITTDFSENLLELITSVNNDPQRLYNELSCLHGFVTKNLNQEIMWPASMPAILPDDNDIDLAYYGESNVGKLKTLYRQGLGTRYGRSMQTIAGVHFNFSLGQKFWEEKFNDQNEFKSITELKNNSYFHLIRNFKRYNWLLVYLFGASPLVDKSFLKGKDHKLEEFDKDTYTNPNAISLRMGGLGYTSKAQQAIKVCFNQLKTYIQTVESARLVSYPEYEKIGLIKNGEYQQLNTHLLQIDNEYYATIRPKNIAKSRESALGALYHRGIEYIEVRLLDCDPFTPHGVTIDQIKFINMFLCWCLQQDSPKLNDSECDLVEQNFNLVVTNGLDPNLKLLSGQDEYPLKELALNILSSMNEFCGTSEESEIIKLQVEKVHHPELLPANKVISLCRDNRISFIEANLNLAKNFNENYNCGEKMEKFLSDLVPLSFSEAEIIKSKDKLEFDDFLKKYFSDIKINYGSIS